MDSIAVIPGYTLLYKFRSLDTDQQVEFAADILLNHRLFAAAPRSFNDPFDCDAPYCFDATEAEKIDRAIARIKKEDPSVGDDFARRLAPARYIAADTNGLAQIRSLVETKLGVVSLAATIDSPLLWAHYASGHTGISIEFRASDLQQLEFFGSAFPVVYQVERPVVNFYRDELTEKVRKAIRLAALIVDATRASGADADADPTDKTAATEPPDKTMPRWVSRFASNALALASRLATLPSGMPSCRAASLRVIPSRSHRTMTPR
jgi:hypothetical protein